MSFDPMNSGMPPQGGPPQGLIPGGPPMGPPGMGGPPPQMQGLGAAPPMKNLMQLWDEMKSWPDEKLMQELQNPSGLAPVAIIAAAQEERNSERERYQNSVAQQPETTVYDDLLAQAQGMGGPQGMEGGAMSPAMDPGMGMDPGLGMGPGLAGAMPSDMMPPGVPGAPIEMGMPSGPPMMQAANGAYPVRGYYEGGELSRHRESEEERILRLEAENPSPSYIDAVRDEERLRSLADVEPSVKSDERRIRELLEEAEYWKQNKDSVEEGRGRGMRGYFEGGLARRVRSPYEMTEEEKRRYFIELHGMSPEEMRAQEDAGPSFYDRVDRRVDPHGNLPIRPTSAARNIIPAIKGIGHVMKTGATLGTGYGALGSNEMSMDGDYNPGSFSGEFSDAHGVEDFVSTPSGVSGYGFDDSGRGYPERSIAEVLYGQPMSQSQPEARMTKVIPSSSRDGVVDTATSSLEASLYPALLGQGSDSGSGLVDGASANEVYRSVNSGNNRAPFNLRGEETFEQFRARMDEVVGGPEDTSYVDELRGKLGTLEKRAKNTWSGPALMQVAASFLSNAPGAGGFGSRLGSGMGAAAPMIQSGMEKDREIEARALRDAIALERVQANERTAARRDKAAVFSQYEQGKQADRRAREGQDFRLRELGISRGYESERDANLEDIADRRAFEEYKRDTEKTAIQHKHEKSMGLTEYEAARRAALAKRNEAINESATDEVTERMAGWRDNGALGDSVGQRFLSLEEALKNARTEEEVRKIKSEMNRIRNSLKREAIAIRKLNLSAGGGSPTRPPLDTRVPR